MIYDQLRDFIINTVFDLGKDTLVKKYEKKQLVSIIEDYLARKESHHEIASLAEEIDFEGFCGFVQTDTFKRLMFQRMDGSEEERGRARDSLWKQAMEYAHADTEAKRRAVAKFITDVSDIIQNFFVSQLGHGEHILAARVEDTILKDNEEKHHEVMSTLERIEKKRENSIDIYLSLLADGDIRGAEELLNNIVQTGNLLHQVKGFYKFGAVTVNGETRLISIPTSEQALKLYPPNVVLDGEVSVDGKQMSKEEMAKYSYDHQKPICVKIKNATAYLGDKIDPAQVTAEGYIGKEYLLIPPPLSKTYDCSIFVGEKEFYSHVLIQVVEKKDNGALVFSNRNQQDAEVLFEFEYVKNRLLDHHFANEDSNAKQTLRFDRFLKAASIGQKEIRIFDKEANQTMISWIPKAFTPEAELGTIDNDIDLLERIVSVEEYYDREFDYRERVTQEELNYLYYLSEMIMKEHYQGTWEAYSDRVRVSDKLRELFEKSNGEYGYIYGVGEVEDKLFGETLNFKFLRIMNHARIVDFEKKKQQLKYADNGDTMKLHYLPVDEPGIAIDIPLNLVLERADNEIRNQILNNDGMVLMSTEKKSEDGNQ